MRLFTKALSIVCSISLGLSVPVHAAPADASPEAIQAKINAELSKPHYKTFDVYDSNGVKTTMADVMKNPTSFEKGFSVGQGDSKLYIRGEALNNGKDGFRLAISSEAAGQMINGQVITIKPGMTDLDIKSRLDDLALSLSTQYSQFKKGDAKRAVASFAGQAACMFSMLMFLAIGGGITWVATNIAKSAKTDKAITIAMVVFMATLTGSFGFGVTCVVANKG